MLIENYSDQEIEMNEKANTTIKYLEIVLL